VVVIVKCLEVSMVNQKFEEGVFLTKKIKNIDNLEVAHILKNKTYISFPVYGMNCSFCGKEKDISFVSCSKEVGNFHFCKECNEILLKKARGEQP